MKKGFTLIELLAVIAILAILVIIAVPTVLKLFQDAKKNTFVTQAQTIYKAAEQQYMSAQISGTVPTSYCFAGGETGTKLDLSGSTGTHYKITFLNNKIDTLVVQDNTYRVTLGSTDTIDSIQAKTTDKGAAISCD